MSKDVENRDPAAAKVEQPSMKDRRVARAADKLRENLKRRKQQLRARRAGEADEGIGLPAAKSTQGDD